MQWLSTKLDNILTWLYAMLQSFFSALFDAIKDVFVFFLDQIFGAIVSLFSLLAVPSFMASGHLASLFSALPPTVVYLLSSTGVFEGFGIIGAGVSFLLLRKIVTLGQW